MKKKLQTAFSPRQYMLSGDFEIYYYSDCHSYNVKSHVHDYYEFYFFLEGDVSIHIHGEEHALSAGDMLLIPPGVPHFAKVRSLDVPYRRFVFWISRTYCRALSGISPDYTYLMRLADETEWYLFHYDLLAFKAVQAKVFRLIEEIHSERFGKAVQISVCVNDLILHLNRTVYEEQHTKMPCEEQGLYPNLLRYIEEHIEEDLSLERLSREFYVSKYHIAHIFKANLGLSVHQFILKKRIRMCRDAICSRTGIGEACFMYGFQDYSSFFRAFKKEFGMSPKEYQELYTKKG